MRAAYCDRVGALDGWSAQAEAPISGFGEPLRRREDPRLLTGDGRFVADLPAAGCLSMVFVRSPVARAAIRGLRLAAARAAPQVVEVYAGSELGSLPRPRVNPVLGELDPPRMPILAEGEVRAEGQPIVAIVAETEIAALEAAALVEMDLDPVEPICDAEAALHAPALFPEMSGNVVADRRWRSGSPDSGFAGAAVIAEVTIRHPRVAPAPLECRASLAQWDAEAECLTVWTGTQTPHRARDDLARALGLDQGQVRVVAPDVGGAFGMKASIYPEDFSVAFAACDLQRPVRWVAARHEDLVSAAQGRGAVTRGRMAFDTSGRILALQADLVFALGAWLPFSTIVPAWNASRTLPGPYAIEHVDVHVRAVVTNTAPVGIYRGAGRPEAAMLLERLLDTGARKLRFDPVAVRQRNLVSAESLPLERMNGTTLDSGDYRALLAKTMVSAGYGRLRSEQGPRRERNDLVGLGWCLYVEPCGQGWESASVTLEPQGRFTVATGSSAQGQGRETTFAQIAARELAVAPDRVRVVHGDTATVHRGVGAVASRSTAIGGSAVQQAVRALIDKARLVGACLLGVASSSLDPIDGGFAVADTPGHRVLSWSEIAARAPEVLHAHAVYAADGEAWGYGCCLAQVSVDRSTGQVGLERLHYVDDAGTVVNPRLVEGQIVGGIAQGIGEALLERVVYDREGRMRTGSLMDYALPRAGDMPALRLDRMYTPSPFNTLGAKGVGEAGAIGAPPAIVNAVLDALAPLGVEHIDMPLTPERVWRAIREADEAGLRGGGGGGVNVH